MVTPDNSGYYYKKIWLKEFVTNISQYSKFCKQIIYLVSDTEFNFLFTYPIGKESIVMPF